MSYLEHFINNLDKIFTVNFTLLAFIITALTILTAINKGVIKEFEDANLISDITKKFNNALNYNLYSGIIAIVGFYLNFNNFFYKIVISIIVIILFFCSLYWTYKTYIWILFFINHQKK